MLCVFKRPSSAQLSQLLGFTGLKHNLQARPLHEWGFRSSHPIPSHYIPLHYIPLHCIPLHPIPLHPIPLHPIPSHCISSHLYSHPQGHTVTPKPKSP